MNRTREILRRRWMLKKSVRTTAQAVGVSHGAVGKVTSRAAAAGLDWEAVRGMEDTELQQRLYGRRQPAGPVRPEPDLQWVHQERKRPSVALELLHLEYLEQHPDGFGYTAFCERYRSWLKGQGLSMRQHHHAGDKAFLDYSGKEPYCVDRETGERVEVELFVAALGASSYTFAEVTPSQQLEHWIGSNARAAVLRGEPQGDGSGPAQKRSERG